MEYITNDYTIFDTLVNYMYVEMNKRFWDKTTPIIFSHIDTSKTVDLCATVIARNYCAFVSQPFYVDMGIFQYWKFCRKYGWKIKRARRKEKKQGLIYYLDNPDDGAIGLFDRPLRATSQAIGSNIDTAIIQKLMEAYYL